MNAKILSAVLLCACALPAFAIEDDHWDDQFGAPGADNTVNNIMTSGSDVYITGVFNTVGEVKCSGIAKWDGTNWTGFGYGFINPASLPATFASVIHRGELYVGGAFFTNVSGVAAIGLAKWNGSTWAQVGEGVNGVVRSLLSLSNELYVGGAFVVTNGSTAISNIARWDGTNWFALGSGFSGSTNGIVQNIPNAMVPDTNGNLIAVGNFRFAGGVEANNVARWDGSQWHALGTGVYGAPGLVVNDVKVLGSDVYVAGIFRSASGVNATNVARWDGAQWNSMGGGPSGTNAALAIVGTNIYVAGNFTNISGVAARMIARWNGTSWQPLAAGTAGEISTAVSCLAVSGQTLYAGGAFIREGNAGGLGIAQWDGNQWSALNGLRTKGLFQTAVAVAASGSDIWVGGSGTTFVIAGGLKVNGLAHWNGSAWDDMGGGVVGAGSVSTIIYNGVNVYVGGSFTNIGGVTARRVAYWDGANWHAMASGFNNTVNALCFHNGQLFAGGFFTFRGDNSAGLHGIALWDGSEWQDVPPITESKFGNVINALVSDGAKLYVGGNYYVGWQTPPPPPIDSDFAENIGYWDGTYWRHMGALTNVNALALYNGELYAGGTFTNSAGNPTKRIARWTGSAWVEVGGGMTNGNVSALAVVGSSLYIGGTFSNANNNVQLSRLIKWNGSQFSPLGTGVRRITGNAGSVAGLAGRTDLGSTNDLYVVGNFTEAGVRQSSLIAHWNETLVFGPPPIIRLLNAGRTGGLLHFDVAGVLSGNYTVEASTNLINWDPIITTNVPNTNFTDPDSVNSPKRTYRAKVTRP